ncbi:MAG: GNAT family N-acetyltransferase [Candidatus Thorarchaeota archaeon]|nr:GNAT family N-acetyltransferase [Candidatus Thorarchaeota archaeon]
MNLRAFKPQDLEQVLTIANRYAFFDSATTEVDFQPAYSFPQGLVVAEVNDRIVGFVFAYLREVPSEVLNTWAASKVAQIELLAVDASYQKQGIGNALLNELLRILKKEGVDIVLLHCPVEAVSAKHLYDKLGFEVRAYAMKKRL